MEAHDGNQILALERDLAFVKICCTHREGMAFAPPPRRPEFAESWIWTVWAALMLPLPDTKSKGPGELSGSYVACSSLQWSQRGIGYPRAARYSNMEPHTCDCSVSHDSMRPVFPYHYPSECHNPIYSNVFPPSAHSCL